jgi:hypothetical protein
MQMMFFRQHFGSLVIGLSDLDEGRERRLKTLDEEAGFDMFKFFGVTSGGVSHPWSHNEYELRVAISGTGLVFDENRGMFDSRAQVFAKVESGDNEVYLAYKRPHSVISYGLPDPIIMAGEIVKIASNHVRGIKDHQDEARWIVVDKPQVPRYHRSLLGKVMSRVKSAVCQGADFFRDPKSR